MFNCTCPQGIIGETFMTEGDVKETAEPVNLKSEQLVNIPRVQWSVGEIAEWVRDPANPLIPLLERVVNNTNPEELLGKDGLVEPILSAIPALEQIGDIILFKRFLEVELPKGDRQRWSPPITEIQKSMAIPWIHNLHHEIITPILGPHVALQELKEEEHEPQTVAVLLRGVLSGIAREWAVLNNLRALYESGVFEKGKGLNSALNPTEVISVAEPVFNRVTGEVLAYFKKILGDNLLDKTGIAVLEEEIVSVPEQPEEERKLRHLLINLMINPLIHGARDGQVVVRKSSPGVLGLAIENVIKKVPLNMEISQGEFINLIDSLLTQSGKVFNGRDLTQTDTMPWQGLGLGLTIARILAAKLGLCVGHRVEGDKVIANVSRVGPQV